MIWDSCLGSSVRDHIQKLRIKGENVKIGMFVFQVLGGFKTEILSKVLILNYDSQI